MITLESEGAVEVTRDTLDISIAIPAYYVGSEFEKVFEAVSGQRSEFAYEVLVVGSGSSKGPGRSPGGTRLRCRARQNPSLTTVASGTGA